MVRSAMRCISVADMFNLDLRWIKITSGMEVLHCQTTAVGKELWVYPLGLQSDAPAYGPGRRRALQSTRCNCQHPLPVPRRGRQSRAALSAHRAAMRRSSTSPHRPDRTAAQAPEHFKTITELVNQIDHFLLQWKLYSLLRDRYRGVGSFTTSTTLIWRDCGQLPQETRVIASASSALRSSIN